MRSLLIVSLSMSLVGCFLKKDDEPDTALLTWMAVDLDDAPLADVRIAVDGMDVGATDATGTLVAEVEAAPERRVRATRAGYVTVDRFVRAREGSEATLLLRLAAEASPVRIDAVENAFLAEAGRDVSLDAPANAFVRADGSAATGAVDVVLTRFDPGVNAELEAYPGALRGRDSIGQEVMLETWGVVDATVRQGEEELQVAPGVTVTVRVPPPTGAGEPPASVATWTLDDATGVWLQDEHDATWDADDGRFVMPRSHLSPENIDRSHIPTCLRGYVRDAEGNGVAGALVKAQTAGAESGVFVAETMTDRDGSYCLYADRETEVDIIVRTTLAQASCSPEFQEGDFCVTRRRLQAGSKGARVSNPFECDPDCKYVRTMTVATPDPGPATQVDCDPPDFGARLGCSSALAAFYACFAPSGACTYELDPFGPFGPEYEMTFENGARTSLEPSALYGLITRFYGPGGEHCGDVIPTGTGSRFNLPGGDVEVDVDDSGRVVMDCGNGPRAVDPVDADYLEGCSASPNGDAGGVECTARPGSFNADCFGSACDEGLECCLTSTRSICARASMCDAMCASDVDCPNDPIPFYCCNVGFYDACVPEGACIN